MKWRKVGGSPSARVAAEAGVAVSVMDEIYIGVSGG
jgi:hypothetical protein